MKKLFIRIVSENGNNKSLDIPSVNMPGKYLQTPSDMTAAVVGLGPNNRVRITQSRDRHASVHLIVTDLDLAASSFFQEGRAEKIKTCQCGVFLSVNR